MGFLSKIKRKIKNNIREYVTTEELIERGMIVGKNFFRGKNVEIDDTFSWLIEIGSDVTLAPGARLLAHDASIRRFLGYTRVGTILIGNKVFIGADSVVLPDVSIGDNVIIGAGSVVTRNVESNCVYAGNPAKKICDIDSYLNRHKNPKKIYIEKDTFKNENLSMQEKIEIKEEIKKCKIAYSK